MELQTILADLDTTISATISFYYSDRSLAKYKYKTKIHGGTLRGIKAPEESLEHLEEDYEEDENSIKEKSDIEIFLEEISDTDKFDPNYEVYKHIYPYYSKRSKDIPEYQECYYIKENRSIIIEHPILDLARDNDLKNLYTYVKYRTCVEQVLEYQKSIKHAGGALGALVSKFDSLIYIPNRLSDLEINTINIDLIGNYTDYVFKESDVPEPVAVFSNGYKYQSSMGNEEPDEFTYVYRMLDLVNYFSPEDISSGELSKLYKLKFLLIELVMLHFNPLVANMRGTLLIIKDKNDEYQKTTFIPDEKDKPNIEEFKAVATKINQEHNNITFNMVSISYLEYLSLLSSRILNPAQIKSKLGAW